MLDIYYEDNSVKIYLGQIITNRALTTDEILYALPFDMDDYAQEHGWDGWDSNCIVAVFR